MFRTSDELFGETAWMQVMVGQGIRPRSYHPMVDSTPQAAVAAMMDNVKTVVQQVVLGMPSHQAYIDSHCKAPPLA